MARSGEAMAVKYSFRPLFTVILLSTTALAQVGTILDHSKLPNCAFSCQTLLNAQSACVPSGGAPTTNQATYQSCFCQSAYLVQFKSTSYDICNGACSTQELQQIQSWYSNLCSAGVVVTPGGSAATTSSSSSTAGATSTSSSTSSTAGKTSNKGSSNQSWIDTHYRWVIMIIVLFLAAFAGIYLGVWLKRRHKRKELEKHRDTTLVAEEAAAALRDRHPETPSMVQLPNGRAGMLQKEVMAHGALVPPMGVAEGSRSSKAKGKARARDNEVREISGSSVEGAQSAFDPDSPPRRMGSKLKRKSSSRRSRSRRDR